MTQPRLLVRPEYETSRIVVPAEDRVIQPALVDRYGVPFPKEQRRPGSVVIHAPLREAIQQEVWAAIGLGEYVDPKLRLRVADGIVLGFNRRLGGLPPIMGGAAGAWAFTNTGRTSLLNGTFDIDSDTFKMGLFLSTSNIGAASTTYAGLTNEVASAFGYTTGGIAVTLTLAGTTTVTVDISVDPVWTASGGSITARFAVIYEVSGNVLCYCLLNSSPADETASDGNTFTVAANASGVFTLA